MGLIVLAFDTATSATTVAVARADRAWEARHDPDSGERPGHVTRLLALVAEAMQMGHVGWPEIDRIAVGVGPGSFTGLRIGVATARALGHSRGIEVVGVSTLHGLAIGAATPRRAILAVLDARRGEAFAAAWVEDVPLFPPAALAPASLAERARSLSPAPLAVGDGAIRFRMDLEAAGAEVPADGDRRHRVSARHHCSLAVVAVTGSSEGVLPDYLRLPDAEIARRAT